MAVLDLLRRHRGDIDVPEGDASATAAAPARATINVGSAERGVSLAAGALLATAGFARRSPVGLAIAGIGAGLLWRGATGRCAVYRAAGIDTAAHRDAEAETAAKGIAVTESFLIHRDRTELYAFWRDLARLPGVLRHLQRVEVLDERRSRWTASAPRLIGGSISWDAEITRDEPGRAIAWRSLPGSRVTTVGEIRFEDAPGDRGTAVRVALSYVPPAGRIGHWLATLSGESAHRQVREDLRAFKRLMEIGLVPSVAGQPRGTCLGHGRRQPG